MGPFLHPSINKERYMLTFLDDCSCYTWVFFLRQKSKVFENLKEFKELVETQSWINIKALHTNNGGEYANKDVQNIFLEVGIQLYHTIPYNPQQNGVAKRKTRSPKET
jgi:transposase InsO family protein